MAGHNFFVVGGGAAAAAVTVCVSVVDIDGTAVINNQYYNGFVSLVVQKSFTRACMVSTVVEEHDGCMPRLKPLLENMCSMDVMSRSIGNFYVFFCQ